MTKRLIPVILSVCAAAVLSAACHAPALEEEIVLPEKEEPVAVPERTTIPFSLKVNTEETKVSYAEGTYQFKTGDYLHVVGTSRTDLEGTLTSGEGSVWSGNLSYLTANGEPSSKEELTVTLVHADNTDMSTYATAIVGAVSTGWDSMLNEAVENYSWFTAATTLDADSATLQQQATFLDVTVTFDFDGSREVEAGQALVDLRTSRGEDMQQTQFYAINAEDFQVHFIAVVAGGQTVSDFILTVGDRAITFADNTTTLYPNKKYTVNRTVTYRPQVGDPFWSDGTYGRLKHPNSEATIVGVVVYVNHEYEQGTSAAAIDDAITEKGAGYGHGLVMALHNVTAGTGDLWGTGVNAGGARWCLSTGKGTKRTGTSVTNSSRALGLDGLNGFENTKTIIDGKEGDGGWDGLGANSAAYLAKNYPVAVSTEHTSGWFLPSIGQWLYTISIDGFGGANHASEWFNTKGENWLRKGGIGNLVCVMENGDSNVNLLVKSLNDRMEQFKNEFAPGVTNYYDAFGMKVNGVDGDNYWTSSEYSADNALRMNLGSVETYNSKKYTTIKTAQLDKANAYAFDQGFVMKVRPFLAF